MLRRSLVGILLLFTASAFAAPKLSVAGIEARRAKIMRNFIIADAAWVAMNMGMSAALVSGSTGETHWFHNANLIFGAASIPFLAAAILSESGSGKLTLRETEAHLDQNQRSLYFLMGLDLAFVMAGAITTTLAPDAATPVRRNTLYGSGKAFLVHGGFFLLLHGLTLISLNTLDDEVRGVLDRVQLTSNSVSLRFDL